MHLILINNYVKIWQEYCCFKHLWVISCFVHGYFLFLLFYVLVCQTACTAISSRRASRSLYEWKCETFIFMNDFKIVTFCKMTHTTEKHFKRKLSNKFKKFVIIYHLHLKKKTLNNFFDFKNKKSRLSS